MNIKPGLLLITTPLGAAAAASSLISLGTSPLSPIIFVMPVLMAATCGYIQPCTR